MKQNDSIINNRYNNLEDGIGKGDLNSTIEIDPVCGIYEETTTEDITDIYSMTKLYERLYEEFEKSPFYEKYGKLTLRKKYIPSGDTSVSNNFVVGEEYDEPYVEEEVEEEQEELPQTIYGLDINCAMDASLMEKYDFKKIDRRDYSDVYYYFKNILVDNDGYSEMEVFCAIAEFFKISYEILYNDVISIESKATILNLLKENHKLGKCFSQVNRLY